MKDYSMREPLPANISLSLNGYPEILQKVLYWRGIESAEAARKFLNADYESDLHDPYLMKDMEKGVDRIIRAAEKDEKTIVYSDYDADGIPSGVIFHDFFKKIGYKNFTNYFPHRFTEGYGLNQKVIETFAKQGVTLIITADCGIADIASVDLATKLGIDVIITDHHLPQDVLPRAYAVINPKRNDCRYPFDMLCGAGVVYKIIQAILQKKNFGLKHGSEKWFLDMVGLATLSDMVPLVGENRVFAKYGLVVLRKTSRLGLRKLIRKLKINQNFLNEDDIGYSLAPRINAASRIGHPEEAFNLLIANDETNADVLSEKLNEMNERRKGISASIVKEIKQILSRRPLDEENNVIVIGNPNWMPTILGPVANNVSESFDRPAFVWGRSESPIIKGSCRSNGRVHLLDLMSKVSKDIFTDYGGHAHSGGFSVLPEKIHLLDQALNEACSLLCNSRGETKLFADAFLTIDDITESLYETLNQVSPFGEANPKPVFIFDQVEIEKVKKFGKEKSHLELIFKKKSGQDLSAIGFFMANDKIAENIIEGNKIKMAASMEKSYFGNYPKLRLRIERILKTVA